MTSAKDRVNKMIAKRQTYNRKNRIAKALNDGCRKLIIQFVNKLDELRPKIGEVGFGADLQTAFYALESRMRLLDEDSDINIYWFDEDTISIDTITVDWSPEYVARAKLNDSLYVFDVPKYKLEEVFFE